MQKKIKNNITRRSFIGASIASVGSVAFGIGNPFRGLDFKDKAKPNLVVIIADQLSLDAIQAHGCKYVKTPNIDKLIKSGVSFIRSYSTSPVCSPARSSIMTGRMPVETGVIGNDRPIHPSVPNIGQWFRQFGYETVYCGKWHLPFGYSNNIDGFDVLPAGGGQGDLVDNVVSRNCQAYIDGQKNSKPFVLVASLMQPHDICYRAIHNKRLVPENKHFGLNEDQFPKLPPNFSKIPVQPQKLNLSTYNGFSEYQWKYYSYIYFRQVEMLDYDIGRIVDSVMRSSKLSDTVIIFTSDHGEGLGRHKLVQKWHPYEESMQVPLVICSEKFINKNYIDTKNLVSGVDIMPTMCDIAGIPVPDNTGISIASLLKSKKVKYREFLSADTNFGGQILRTDRYKYVRYPDDPVEMLFDLEKDPYETLNLYDNPAFSDILVEHRKMLEKFNSRLRPVEPMPVTL